MELQRLLEHYVYGAPPARGFTARVTKTLDGVCGDRGVLHEIELTLDGLEAPDAPRIRLALFLPADATSRVPLFLGLNRCANHTVVADAAPTIIERRWLHAARSQGAPRGGCALSRANDQETVERITRVCPRWFDGRFRAFADDGARLPLDQHLLALLVAPQPVLETVGLQGTWANDARSLRGLRAAAPVWELLGAPPPPPRGGSSGRASSGPTSSWICGAPRRT